MQKSRSVALRKIDQKEIDQKEISDLVTQKIIIDSRNLLNKNKWEKAGFTFIGNGYN